jgi:transposase
MKDNMLLTNYKGRSQEELEKLPSKELAKALHEAIKEWDKLCQQLKQDSTNSSRAPSSDSPGAKAKRKDEQESSCFNTGHKGHKQGAQIGHKAVELPLVDIGENDVVFDRRPKECTHCGASLETCSDPEPYRRQKFEIEITRRVTEYRKHRLTCPECGHVEEGVLPPEARGSAYGENIVLLAGVLTGTCQVSRRTTKMILEKLCGVPISLGSLSNLERELTEAAMPVMKEIEEEAQKATQGNADETGFNRNNGETGWLWVLVTPCAVLFRLFEGRGQKWAEQLLGCFAGILTSDRWNGYNRYPGEKRQLCWAHLKRDFKAMEETGGDGKVIGGELRRETQTMFRLWHRFRRWKAGREKAGAEVSMARLEEQMGSVRERIRVLLEEGARRCVIKCREILKVEPLLWTYTRVADVEPTNNAAERAIRPAVLLKKRTFGTKSERGSRYVESMLSIWGTCRCNNADAVSFLRELIHAHRSNTPLPSIFNPSPHSQEA